MQPYISLLLFGFLFACEAPDPNNNPSSGENEFKTLEVETQINEADISFSDLIYVPIYSDIYIDQQNQNTLLAATLSIRNSSYDDSLFVSKIDYFSTDGSLVRSYLDRTISLPPMGTVNYVIERDDDTGGPGANFMVEISAKNPAVRPIVQAVMIGQNGNKAFSFITDGYSVLQ
ncbi:MAG: DUF3124 domain-containing protein [Bacteroidota bacterium]